jgi:hypothetical protein
VNECDPLYLATISTFRPTTANDEHPSINQIARARSGLISRKPNNNEIPKSIQGFSWSPQNPTQVQLATLGRSL